MAADNTSTIATVFDYYSQNYNKDVGAKNSTTGVYSEKKYSSSTKSQVNDLQKNSFQGKKNANLLNASNLQSIISQVLSTDLTSLTFGNLLKSLNSLDLITGNVMRDAGLAGLIDTLGTLENIAGNVLQKFLAAILSQIYIPDAIYLASLIGLDAAGADLEMNDNYIRNLILKRDLTICLKWWNDTWGVTYSGLSSDTHQSDAVTAARSGAWENVRYILDALYKSYNHLNATALNENDITQQKTYLSNANLVYETIVYCVKLIIVYGYGNFTAGNVRDMIKAYKISPKWFGTTDDRFSGRFIINSGDIDVMAPYYQLARGGLLDDIDKIMQNRSSRYRRSHANNTSVIDLRNKYINPRNKNVKRIYLTLTDPGQFSNDTLFNIPLATRLELKIMSTIGAAVDESLTGFIPQGFFDTENTIWDSAYNYTKKIESWLKNPPKMQYIILADTDVVKAPSAIPNATGTTNSTPSNPNGLTNTQSTVLGTKLLVNDIQSNNLSDLPTAFDDYIKQLVDTYVNLDIQSYLSKVLTDIQNGLTSITTNSNMESLILDKFKQLGGDIFEYVKMNMGQVYNQLVADIQSGAITINPNNIPDITDLQRQVVTELTNSGVYIQLQNNANDINILKLMMQEMQDTINGIAAGNISINGIDLKTLLNNANARNNAGENGDIGQVSQVNQMLMTNLNNTIYNPSVSNVGYNVLTQSQTLANLIASAQDEIKNGMKIVDNAEQAILLVNANSKDLYNQLMAGSLNLTNFPSMQDLLNIANQTIKNSTDISAILKALEDMGVDISGIDPYLQDIKKINDTLNNSDPEMFDFNINNPPPKVINSLYQEYYGTNVINILYQWVDDSNYMIPFTY